MLKLASCIAVACVFSGAAYPQVPQLQLQPDYYVRAYGELTADLVDRLARANGAVNQLLQEVRRLSVDLAKAEVESRRLTKESEKYAAQAADLQKKLAEAEARVPPYPIDPNISD